MAPETQNSIRKFHQSSIESFPHDNQFPLFKFFFLNSKLKVALKVLQDVRKKQVLQQAAFLMKTLSRKCPRKFVCWTVFVKSLNAGSPNLKKMDSGGS